MPKIKSNIACKQPLCDIAILFEYSKANDAHNFIHCAKIILLLCLIIIFNNIGKTFEITKGDFNSEYNDI